MPRATPSPSGAPTPAKIAAKWKASHVIATTRKRCPNCNRMVEVGEAAVLRDATSVKTAQHWIGQGAYKRGAWHLYHPDCFATLVEFAERLAKQEPEHV